MASQQETKWHFMSETDLQSASNGMITLPTAPLVDKKRIVNGYGCGVKGGASIKIMRESDPS